MNNLKYTCLFGGGAIRGLAYVGVLRALEELGIESDIIAGSSVGAVFSLLYALGYKSYELENILMKVNFELFKDIHLGFAKTLGLSKGEIFIDWLNDLIAKKIQDKSLLPLKFKDLDKRLVIVATNLRDFSPQEFSALKTPDFEIAKAIKISSSMPGLMQPTVFERKVLVDGDLQKGSPMWRLSSTLQNSDNRIIEFRLEGACGESKKNPISYINTIYSCMTEVSSDFICEMYGKNDRYDCVKLNTGHIFFADLNLNKEERRKLINSGYEQTMHYFKEILPEKKRNILNVYENLLKILKAAYKGVKSNNVEETQWCLGDIYITLYENKDIIDEKICEAIQDFKNFVDETSTTILFFHSTFREKQELLQRLSKIIDDMKVRVSDIKYFLQNTDSTGE